MMHQNFSKGPGSASLRERPYPAMLHVYENLPSAPEPDKGCVSEACEGDGKGKFSIFVSLRSPGGAPLVGEECKYLPKQDHISFRNVTAWAREHYWLTDFRLVVLDANPPVILNDAAESADKSLKQLGINIWKSQNQNVLLSDATEVHIDVQLAKEVGGQRGRSSCQLCDRTRRHVANGTAGARLCQRDKPV